MTATTFRLLLGTAAIAFAHPAMAQELSADQAQQLIDRLDALEAEVGALRAELAAAKASNAEVKEAAEAAYTVSGEAKEEAGMVATYVKTEPDITMKAAPEVESNGFTFKPRGRLLVDIASVDAPGGIDDPGLGLATEVRRARLGVSGDMPGGLGYKLELDFADNDVEFTDAIVTYGDGPLGLTLGQHNNHQSLEELTSSNYTSFMERAAFTDAFGFERRVGLSVDYSSGDFMVAGGLFSANIDDLTSDEENAYGVDGRIVFSPKMGAAQLHFGGSAHWRDLGEGSSRRYRQRPFVHTTDTRFLDTGEFDVDSETSYGLEAAMIRGPFHITGETHWFTPSMPGADDPTFFGAYAEAGYFLTGGDTRGYSGGKFDRTKPEKPLGEGGWGALQANVRYDHLDLSDAGIIGGRQDAYAVSLIWTPMNYLRFILNYGRLQYEDAALLDGADADYGVDVVGMRAQVDF